MVRGENFHGGPLNHEIHESFPVSHNINFGIITILNFLLQDTSKLSANQRKLAKVDKTGMKSITSFFAPKSKKS